MILLSIIPMTCTTCKYWDKTRVVDNTFAICNHPKMINDFVIPYSSIEEYKRLTDDKRDEKRWAIHYIQSCTEYSKQFLVAEDYKCEYFET